MGYIPDATMEMIIVPFLVAVTVYAWAFLLGVLPPHQRASGRVRRQAGQAGQADKTPAE